MKSQAVVSRCDCLESTKKEIARGCIIINLLNSVTAGGYFISLIYIETNRCVREREREIEK